MADARRAGGRARASRARHERALAEARADLEERTRLALWRMDALGAAIVLGENRHPLGHYDLKASSPFLTSTDPEVNLHFQIRRGWRNDFPELDEPNITDTRVIEIRKERLIRLRTLLAANPLPGDEWTQLNCAAEASETTWNAVPKDAPKEQEANMTQRQNKDGGDNRRDSTYQSNSNTKNTPSGQRRSKNIDDSISNEGQMKAAQKSADKDEQVDAVLNDDGSVSQIAASSDVTPMRGVWLGGELFLLRQLREGIRILSASVSVIQCPFSPNPCRALAGSGGAQAATARRGHRSPAKGHIGACGRGKRGKGSADAGFVSVPAGAQ